MPGCYDAMSAKLVQTAGFEVVFMSGFCVSGARLAMPDTGLISYHEMVDQGRNICNAVSIPVIGDGDTGFGNALNVKRTVQGYADAGFACIMIEDQVAPKRCGHTRGKTVVPREQALMRLQAADARDEGADILIMARTDARATDGLEEGIARARAFTELGFRSKTGDPDTFLFMAERMIDRSDSGAQQGEFTEEMAEELFDAVREDPLVSVQSDFVLVARAFGLLSGIAHTLGHRADVLEAMSGA